jgi:hypothetical protein
VRSCNSDALAYAGATDICCKVMIKAFKYYVSLFLLFALVSFSSGQSETNQKVDKKQMAAQVKMNSCTPGTVIKNTPGVTMI